MPSNKANNKKSKNQKNKKQKNGNAPRGLSYPAKSKTRAPRMKNSGNMVVVSHVEMMTDIVQEAGDFPLWAYRINPANANMFPWLSGIAVAYESYRFRSLKFVYTPLLPSTVGGSMLMAVDYDVRDPSPTTRVEVATITHNQVDNINKPMTFSISHGDCKTLGEQRYTLMNSDINDESVVYPASTDARTFDLGYFNIVATATGVAAGAQLGYLRVSYEVELTTPQPRPIPTLAEVEGKVINNNPPNPGGPEGYFGVNPETYGVFKKLARKVLANRTMTKLTPGQQYYLDMFINAATGGSVVDSPLVEVVSSDATTTEGKVTLTNNTLSTTEDTNKRRVSYVIETNPVVPGLVSNDTWLAVSKTAGTAVPNIVEARLVPWLSTWG